MKKSPAGKQAPAADTPDPFGAILKAGDSLLLTRVQVESLQQARATYRSQTDSVWATLSEYLAASFYSGKRRTAQHFFF